MPLEVLLQWQDRLTEEKVENEVDGFQLTAKWWGASEIFPRIVLTILDTLFTAENNYKKAGKLILNEIVSHKWRNSTTRIMIFLRPISQRS